MLDCFLASNFIARERACDALMGDATTAIYAVGLVFAVGFAAWLFAKT